MFLYARCFGICLQSHDMDRGSVAKFFLSAVKEVFLTNTLKPIAMKYPRHVWARIWWIFHASRHLPRNFIDRINLSRSGCYGGHQSDQSSLCIHDQHQSTKMTVADGKGKNVLVMTFLSLHAFYTNFSQLSPAGLLGCLCCEFDSMANLSISVKPGNIHGEATQLVTEKSTILSTATNWESFCAKNLNCRQKPTVLACKVTAQSWTKEFMPSLDTSHLWDKYENTMPCQIAQITMVMSFAQKAESNGIHRAECSTWTVQAHKELTVADVSNCRASSSQCWICGKLDTTKTFAFGCVRRCCVPAHNTPLLCAALPALGI